MRENPGSFTALKQKGVVVVDDGAKRALQEKGRSLLPSGIVDVQGDFDRGAIVAIADLQGNRFAKGITNYSSLFVERIKGLKSDCITQNIWIIRRKRSSTGIISASCER